MDHAVLVGTHHKSGTMWMLKIFQSFGASSSIPFLYFSEHCRRLGISGVDSERLLLSYCTAFRGILLADHSEGFRAVAERRSEHRAHIVHVVRDPRDIAISSASYHVRSTEPWLHVPQPAFGGMTYQQKISSYPEFEDRVLFEIDHSAAEAVAEIRSLLDVDGIETFKYEELMTTPATFERLFICCGFPSQFRERFRATVYEQSFFGADAAQQSEHATDGRVEQWRAKLTERAASAAERAFGDVIAKLDYPTE